MAEEYAQQEAGVDPNSFFRDIEEKQRLVKERMLLIGKTLIEERDKVFNELQAMKTTIAVLTEENKRMRELLQRLAEQINISARKEELMILQRQFDLFRKG